MKWLGASAELTMSHSVEAVWEFVSNVENFGRWADGVREPQWTSEGERGVGSTYSSKYVYAGKTSDVEYEITSFEPPNKLGSRTTAGPFPYQGTISIESVEDGTKVVHDMMAGSDGAFTEFMFKYFGRLMLRPLMRKRLRKELHAMSDEIGRDTATAESA